MYWEMTPRCVLLNLLLVKDEILISTLNDFKKNLLARVMEDGLYIDLSRSSLRFAIESSPNLFEMDGDLIKRSSDPDDFFDKEFLDRTENRCFPENIRAAIHEVCEST